jgi:hypothetical protein
MRGHKSEKAINRPRKCHWRLFECIVEARSVLWRPKRHYRFEVKGERYVSMKKCFHNSPY